MDRDCKGCLRQVYTKDFITSFSFSVNSRRIFDVIWFIVLEKRRTDNAVKNRFSTLCKKRAKYEALAKENSASYMNSNSKRVMLRSGFSTNEGSAKKMRLAFEIRYISFIDWSPFWLVDYVREIEYRRTHIADVSESGNFVDRSHKLRPPLTVLAQNSHNINRLSSQHHDDVSKETVNDGNKID